MASMNRSLNPHLDTVFMMTSKDYFFVSSRTIKEVASLGGAVEGLVPGLVAKRLRQRFKLPVSKKKGLRWDDDNGKGSGGQGFQGSSERT